MNTGPKGKKPQIGQRLNEESQKQMIVNAIADKSVPEFYVNDFWVADTPKESIIIGSIGASPRIKIFLTRQSLRELKHLFEQIPND